MTDVLEPHYDAIIDGQWRGASSGRSYPLINPATGQEVTTVARCDEQDIDAAVRSARAAFAAWRDRPAAERGRLLLALAQALRDDAERLAGIESANSGKSHAEALNDIATGARFFEFYAGFAVDARGETLQDPPSLMSFTVREPYGVTGHIVPWNAPLHSAARSIAPALAVGNTAVAKPSEEAPLTCLALGELATTVGIPPGVLNVVPGIGEEAGAALAAHPDVPRISFTGSVETGKLVLKAAAEHLAYVTLELGGKSANLVFADADLDLTVEGVLKSILTLAGQTCAAGSRLLVERPIHDELVGRLVERMDAIGRAPDAPRLCPIISKRQHERVQSFVREAIAEGAKLRTAVEEGAASTGFYVRPALFTDVRPDMRLAREEVFGPVLAVFPFDDEAEAVALANDSDYGLTAGVWTRDLDRALRLSKVLDVGTVYINRYFASGVELPLGGFKNSGIGHERGRLSLDEYTRVKGVSINVAPLNTQDH